MGTIVIDSVPPATTTSANPARIRSAAIAIDCSPEEQNRLIVIAGTLSGSPAFRAQMRATFIPCSASGIAQPRITSSMRAGSRFGTRSSAAADRRRAEVVRAGVLQASLVRPPTAVRTDAMIYALPSSYPSVHAVVVRAIGPL